MNPNPAKPGINSVVSELTRSHGSFGRFWKILQETAHIESRPRTPQVCGDHALLFPSCLVVPNEPCISKSARSRARRRGRVDSWEHTSVVWALFTFLEGGAPYRENDLLSLATRARAAPWTKDHAHFANRLNDQINRFVRLRTHEPLSRGDRKLSEFIDRIRPDNSHYKPGPIDLDAMCQNAKPVKPERMSLPEKAGILDPRHFLKGSNLEVFENFASRVPHDIPPPKPTKAVVKVDPSDLPKVYRKLIEAGVATLIPTSMALRDKEGNIVSGGLFAVAHKEATDRIILDRRPQNELEKRVIMAKLPHGSLFTQLIIPKSCSIRASGDDLSNYFYLLKHHEEWLGRNTVGKPVKGSMFADLGFNPEEEYILSFRVIAMGDCNAVDLAQETHLQILQDAGCMRPEEVVSFRNKLPAKLTWEGLYIDDHVVTQIVHKRKYGKKQSYRDDEIIKQSRDHYAKLGIPISKKKQFTHLHDFVAWGTSVNSETGRVGTPLPKLKQMASLIVDVCKLTRVTQKLIQKTVGLLIHPCMHRRIFMSLLQETYAWCSRLESGKSYRMPVSVREELLWMALCLPLVHCNARWPISQRIGASDASSTGGGRAVTVTKPHVAKTLFRFSEHVGEAVRLDWLSGSLAPETSMHSVPEDLERLMLAHTWTTSHRCTFAHKQRINVLEMKMVRAELIDLVSKIRSPHRAILLVDSRVVVGAFSKGRSSSRQLNRILRSLIGWSVAGEKSLHLVWVRSKSNPSDHPSRGLPIPEPIANDPILQKTLGESGNELQTRRSNKKINAIASQNLLEDNSVVLTAKQKDSVRHPAQKHWCFKEFFSGKGQLTHTFRRSGAFTVLQEVELIQKGKPSPDHDILNDSTFAKLCKEAKRQRSHIKFGTLPYLARLLV